MKKWITTHFLITLIPTTAMILAVGGCGNSASTNKEQGVSPVVGMIQKLWPGKEAQQKELWDKLVDKDADVRREGVYELGDKPASKWKNTPQMLSIIAQGDPDGQVRVSALAVLASLDEEVWLPQVLQTSMGDIDNAVRAKTVEIFGDRQNDEHMKNLLVMLADDPEPSIRAAVATALGNYKGRQVIRALMEGLVDDNFSVNYRSRQSLVKITGQDFGYDDHAWLQWLATTN